MRILLFLLFVPFSLFADEIKVSIRPLQSIVANLTKGAKTTSLIVEQNESLHNCYLKPTQIRSLYNSKMIILIDKNFENFLSKPLANIKLNETKVIEVAKLPGIELLEDEENHHYHHGHNHSHASLYDYHIWLDIDIVKVISTELIKIFINMDPEHAEVYKNNLAEFLVKLDKLDQMIEMKMEKIKDYKFIVSHNAYQYFIDRYDLEQPKAVSIDHDNNIGAREFIQIQELIKTSKAKCIFEEPQFESKIIEKIKQTSNIKICKLDAEWGPEDTSLENAYVDMMMEISDSFYRCLKD